MMIISTTNAEYFTHWKKFHTLEKKSHTEKKSYAEMVFPIALMSLVKILLHDTKGIGKSLIITICFSTVPSFNTTTSISLDFLTLWATQACLHQGRGRVRASENFTSHWTIERKGRPQLLYILVRRSGLLYKYQVHAHPGIVAGEIQCVSCRAGS